jgi:putative transposase
VPAIVYVERLIGSIRRECLDHVVIVNAAGLCRVMTDYVAYYLGSRTHLSLNKDAPVSCAAVPPTKGDIVGAAESCHSHARSQRIDHSHGAVGLPVGEVF